MESPFQYREGQLTCDGVPLSSIAAECGTPVYVYSAQGILDRFRAYEDVLAAIPHKICYAVKANANLAILGLLARSGCGFDIVSAGELFRVLRAGGDPASIVFSGVGKTAGEIEYALTKGIHSFNCESHAELATLSSVAVSLGRTVSLSIRVNPDVDAATHPYISTGMRDHKFGIDINKAPALYERAASLPGISPEGVSCHIGSQIMDPAPLLEAVVKVVDLAQQLIRAGLPIRHLDLGGGLGVAYTNEQRTPAIANYLKEVIRLVGESKLTVMVEPGRSIVAESGALLTMVLAKKTSPSKQFIIVDAAMNDLIRPSLYQAYHEIVPVAKSEGPHEIADVVGPVCETGDFLARERSMPPVKAGDLLAVLTAGAYGFVLSSNYNARPRVAEVLVGGGTFRTVRTRESFEDLVRGETL